MSHVREDGYTREQGYAAVGDGWRALVDRAFDALPADMKIVQVKEKFGKLRIYAEMKIAGAEPAPFKINAYPGGRLDGYAMPGHPGYWQFLTALEGESGEVCEDCGKPGRTQRTSNGYWIRTVCADHTTTPSP